MTTERQTEIQDDPELDARLSRIASEISEVRRMGEADETTSQGIVEIEERFKDIAAQQDHARRLLAVHEIEAMLCILKPEPLLYTTWIRLRESLYRFDKARRASWERDLGQMFCASGVAGDREIIRQRLRQLILELQESAARYNRLAIERAAVTRVVNKFGIFLVVVFLVTLVLCFALSNLQVSSSLTLAVMLIACAVSGGMAATFGRLTTIRSERVRHTFAQTFKWDMGARACLGAVSAVFIAAALLSGFLPIDVPENATKRLFFLVLFGFGAGFSDRLFNQTLERVIGSRAPRPTADSD